jgi:predicted transcriptional regulator
MSLTGDFGDCMEEKARLTILIDPAKKKAFEELCSSQDVTSSQMVRQLIRQYLDKHGVQYAPVERKKVRK